MSELLEEERGIENSIEPVSVTEETPVFKNISITDVEVKGALQAIFIQGLPEMNVENIKLTNILLKADRGITIVDASNVEIDNIHLITKNKKAIDIFNTKDLEIKGIDYDFNSENAITVRGDKCMNISISNENPQIKEFVFVGKKVKEGTVKF